MKLERIHSFSLTLYPTKFDIKDPVQVGSVGEIEPTKDFAEVFDHGDKRKLKISEVCWSIEEVKRADEFFLQCLEDQTPQKISLTLRGRPECLRFVSDLI